MRKRKRSVIFYRREEEEKIFYRRENINDDIRCFIGYDGVTSMLGCNGCNGCVQALFKNVCPTAV